MIKKILISQPKPASEKSPYFDIEKNYGVEMVFRPFIKVEGLTAKEFRQQKIDILSYTAIVFTSRHAIDNFFQIAKDMRLNIPETMKYFCVTETISLYIQKYVQYRKRKVFFGTSGKVDDLLPVMLRHKGEKYLVPQSSAHTDELTKLFDAKGLNHKECIMYRTVSNNFSEEEIQKFDCDMLIFSTPTGVHYLSESLPGLKEGKYKIGVFGPATAKAVESAGLKLDLMAGTPEYPSMVAALKAYLEKENSK
ncbi:MAG TPA: uroporphyrinogen-III synthase [Prevotella sp.]|nr:uroporphyrinogen-III synthase [Prevotella sp.]